MLNPLSHELGGFAARHGFAGRMTATAIVQVANEQAAGRYIARSFRQGQLVIEVVDAEARHLLQPAVPALISNAMLA